MEEYSPCSVSTSAIMFITLANIIYRSQCGVCMSNPCAMKGGGSVNFYSSCAKLLTLKKCPFQLG